MVEKRLIGTIVVTAVCVWGLGFYMQSSAPRTAAQADAPILASSDVVVPTEPETANLSIQGITLTSIQGFSEGPSGQVGRSPVQTSTVCAMQVVATPRPGAVVELDVSAPCRSSERITVHHNGMMFTDTLDAKGQLSVDVPALAKTATFIVEAKGVETTASSAAVATVEVPGFDEVERVVLQWDGSSGFEIHALEFGAQYGDKGHVWHGAAVGMGQGYVVQLGDADQLAPQLAQVYSLPITANGQSGVVEISVETEITEINCGRDIAAQTLLFGRGGVQTRDLVLSMPDCDAAGDFLVLNNLVENLKIAAN